jgi:TrmH family RNA methyltransferase
MANMGLSRLVLVEPAVEVGRVAKARARGAVAILARARRVPSLAEALAPFRRVVGTTSLRGRQLATSPIAPRDLAEQLAASPRAPTALLFGPEKSGLTAAELALCSSVVAIPAARRLPTLNLAQAVLVLAYELYVVRIGSGAATAEMRRASPPGREAAAGEAGRDVPASFAEVEGLFAQLEPFLAEIGFARDTTFPGVLRDLRHLAARSAPSHREVAILRGICRRASLALSRGRRGGGPER